MIHLEPHLVTQHGEIEWSGMRWMSRRRERARPGVECASPRVVEAEDASGGAAVADAVSTRRTPCREEPPGEAGGVFSGACAACRDSIERERSREAHSEYSSACAREEAQARTWGAQLNALLRAMTLTMTNKSDYSSNKPEAIIDRAL